MGKDDKKNKKILFIQPTITHMAGIDMAIMPIINELSQIENVKISTLSIFEKFETLKSFENGAINYTLNESLKNIDKENKIKKIHKMLVRSYKFYKFICNKNFDCIICSGDGLSISLSFTILILKKINSKANTVFISYMHENLKNISGINKRILRKVLPKFDKVICVSEGLRQSIDNYINCKGEDVKSIVLYNTFVKSDKLQMRIKAFNNKTFLAVGRLEKVKGNTDLIKAFIKFKSKLELVQIDKSKNEIVLEIIGDGNEREELEKLIAENNAEEFIKLLGHRDREFIYEKLATAYAFINNSKMETFGVSLLEAMSIGVPLIINNCEFGPAEICEQDRAIYLNVSDDAKKIRVFDYGIMCEEGNVESLAQALGLICEDDIYNSFDTNKEIIRAEEFSKSKIVAKWKELFIEVD
mgnify:CR=1 FL=1